jgi:hypothetical protein
MNGGSMRYEIFNEYQEITVNVNLSGEDVPVISTSRGWTFQPKTLHALWVRENAGSWELIGVELKGRLPKSGKRVSANYWLGIPGLPEWIGKVVTETTPIEVLQIRDV